jgi:hypothetical protein
VIRCGTLGHELRKPKGTSNSMILVPLFDLKFLRWTRVNGCRNFTSAALVWLWFRSPHFGLAARMMRTSEPQFALDFLEEMHYVLPPCCHDALVCVGVLSEFLETGDCHVSP